MPKPKPQLIPAAPASLADLKPAPYNPRSISPAAAAGLGESMRLFGDLSGIVFNTRTGNLVAGHQRREQLEKAGGKYDPKRQSVLLPNGEAFPVRLVDWDEATEKAANLTANNPAIAGVFTPETAQLLAEVKLAMPAEFAAVNLGGLALPEAFGNETPPEGMGEDTPPEHNRAAELRDKYAVEAGQVWQLGVHRLICGDSSGINANHDEVVFFDPPWDIDYKIDYSSNQILAFTDCQRQNDIIKKIGAPSWVFIWDCVSSWYTPNRPLKRAKLCLFYGDISKYDFDGAHYGEPLTAKTVTNSRGSYEFVPNESGKHLSDIFKKQITKFHHESETGHSHEKPIEWVQMLIQNCTKGDIFDPFCGSGTSIIAAQNLGRKCRAVEISPNYVAVALERWARHTGQEPVLL